MAGHENPVKPPPGFYVFTLRASSAFTRSRIYVRAPIEDRSSIRQLNQRLKLPMKYLIVDDHPMTRQVVIDSLRESGAEFAEAATGEEAIAYCEAHSPDWIIMDVRMPGRGGLFASRQILSRRPESRILVMSQCGDDLVANEARAAGAIDFVSKDRIEELPAILRELDFAGS